MSAIRDPVHGWIKFSEAERRIIDTPIVQRLKFISQLTATFQVFPGGTHNRFTHSLGVMKLAGKYVKHLLKTSKIDNPDYFIRLARVAGLLHDIGHGPFSHAFDRSVYSKMYGITDGGHDLHRLRLIRHPSLEAALVANGILIEDLERVWTASPEDGLFHIIKIIVGGPLGADRMDFIKRDSYFTGTAHFGTIASDRIITNSGLTEDGRLYYNFKVMDDIIQALDGRRFMYDDVYFHKASDAAGLLIQDILELATEEMNLIEETQDIDKFILLNDYTLIGRCMSASPNLRELCERLLTRQLPKLVFEQKVKFGDKIAPPLNESVRMVESRAITGIDPEKFDRYCIFIKDKRNGFLTCQEAIDKSQITPIPPYRIVRVFSYCVLSDH